MKNYQISLKGYVGGEDFDRKTVDRVLANNEGKHVDVLIDSLGGSLATGLSISSAFALHGDVSVHYVGLNASAATVASLGAKHVSIDAGAMYLVHKASMDFFEFGNMNADQFAEIIGECEKIKQDLDKVDCNIARLYAARCKRSADELLELMKRGGWMTAKEALEWGFVDEITDYAGDVAACLTDDIAASMAAAGIPLPDMPAKYVSRQPMSKLIEALKGLFRNQSPKSNKIMKKICNSICAILAVDSIEVNDDSATLTSSQLDAIEDRLTELKKTIAKKDDEIVRLTQELENASRRPADETARVVEDTRRQKQPADDPVDAFVKTANTAKQLFNSLP